MLSSAAVSSSTGNSTQPIATTNIRFTMNFDPRTKVLDEPFPSGFIPSSLSTELKTNFSSEAIKIYDSLGEFHNLKMHAMKAPEFGKWQIAIEIDGFDVTPEPTKLKNIGSAGRGVSYHAEQIAKPFCIMFHSIGGKFIPYNPNALPISYGKAALLSKHQFASKKKEEHLSEISDASLLLNDVKIEFDEITEDRNLITAKMITDKINEKTNEHKVVAKVEPTVLSFVLVSRHRKAAAPIESDKKPNSKKDEKKLTDTPDDIPELKEDDFVINGKHITGKAETADAQGLAKLINDAEIPGIKATGTSKDSGNSLTITDKDGGNVRLQSSAIKLINGWCLKCTNPADYTFDLADSKSDDIIIRGRYSLSMAKGWEGFGIQIAGENISCLGLTENMKTGILQQCSDKITINDIDPANGAELLSFKVDFDSCTSFPSETKVHNIYQDGEAGSASPGSRPKPIALPQSAVSKKTYKGQHPGARIRLIKF